MLAQKYSEFDLLHPEEFPVVLMTLCYWYQENKEIPDLEILIAGDSEKYSETLYDNFVRGFSAAHKLEHLSADEVATHMFLNFIQVQKMVAHDCFTLLFQNVFVFQFENKMFNYAVKRVW